MENQWSIEQLTTQVVMRYYRLDQIESAWSNPTKSQQRYIKQYKQYLDYLEKLFKKRTKKKEREQLIEKSETFLNS